MLEKAIDKIFTPEIEVDLLEYAAAKDKDPIDFVKQEGYEPWSYIMDSGRDLKEYLESIDREDYYQEIFEERGLSLPVAALNVPDIVPILTDPRCAYTYTMVNAFAKKAMERFDEVYARSQVSTQIDRSPRVKEYLEQKQWLNPEFTLLFGDNSEQAMADLNKPIPNEKARRYVRKGLVIYQLPKPVAHFWSKGVGVGEAKWGTSGKDIEGMAIEWGKLYREYTPKIWQTRDEAKQFGLELYRINGTTIHDPDKFYYIWAAHTPLHERVIKKD